MTLGSDRSRWPTAAGPELSGCTPCHARASPRRLLFDPDDVARDAAVVEPVEDAVVIS